VRGLRAEGAVGVDGIVVVLTLFQRVVKQMDVVADAVAIEQLVKLLVVDAS